MTVRVVSAPPAMKSPVSCIIDIGSMSASVHTEMRSSVGQPLRSAAISSSSGLNSMIADITPMAASGSRSIESVRMSRSDHVLMSSQRSSGNPRRSAVSRDGSWAARSCTTSSCAGVGDRVEQLVDPALRGTPRPGPPPAG